MFHFSLQISPLIVKLVKQGVDKAERSWAGRQKGSLLRATISGGVVGTEIDLE